MARAIAAGVLRIVCAARPATGGMHISFDRVKSPKASSKGNTPGGQRSAVEPAGV
jgi:hypothetical protein